MDHGHPVVVDSFIMVFFLDRAACGDPRPVMDAFSAFLQGPGRGMLRLYVDENGDMPPLPPDPMTVVTERIGDATDRGELAALTLCDTDGWGGRHEAKYYYNPEGFPRWPDSKAYLLFRIGQDRVLEDGIVQMVEFVRRLTYVLPYSYAYASPALAYGERIFKTREVIHRRPGFDVAHTSACAMDLDARPLGAYWLSVFNRHLSDALGGAERLSAHLPGAAISPVGQGGVMLLLGDEPDVGDVNRGNALPSYRALARVLEPMLQVPKVIYMRDENGLASPELQQAWHKRFLAR
jgi:hypothetical protein